jgi:hypothetical protein
LYFLFYHLFSQLCFSSSFCAYIGFHSLLVGGGNVWQCTTRGLFVKVTFTLSLRLPNCGWLASMLSLLLLC